MFNMDEEKDRLTKALSEPYSQNLISMEEYERMLEYINKIETKREVSIVEKIIRETALEDGALTAAQNNDAAIPAAGEKHLSVFSWRTTNIKPVNGNAGKFISLFGANRIIVDTLPRGRTVLKVSALFGLTEILVSKNIKITNKVAPIFSGVFSPNEINRDDADLPELYIVGKAVFGNITIRTIDEFNQATGQEKEFAEKVKEKILQKIYDKI
jgi:hypothetical protein